MMGEKLQIDVSGKAGLAPKFFGDEGDTFAQRPENRYIGKVGQMASGTFNPVRKYGYMCPPNAEFLAISEDSGGANFIKQFRATLYVPSSGVWFAGEHSGNSWTGASATDNELSIFRQPTGSDVIFTDFEIYQVNGVTKIFYAYQEASGGNIGIANADGSSPDDDWLSTVPTGAFKTGATSDVCMIPADNGFMYVLDTNAVHKIDGTTAGGAGGTVTANVLLFPPFFNLPDGIDWKGSLWIAVQNGSYSINTTATYENFCGVYVWDRQSTTVQMRDFIPIKGARAIRKIYVTPQGQVRVMVVSSSGTLQLREYNGTVFETIAETHILSTPFYRDSVSTSGDMMYWIGQRDGRIYGHGAITPGEEEGLYLTGDASALPADSSYDFGAILFLAGTSATTTTRTGFVISVDSSTAIPVNRWWFPNTTETIFSLQPSTLAGNVYTLQTFFPQLVKINYVRIYHHVGTSTGVTVKGTLDIYLNQNTTSVRTENITLNDVVNGYKYIPVTQGAKSGVFAIQFKFSWTAGQTISDASDWMPRFIEVDYEPLQKLK